MPGTGVIQQERRDTATPRLSVAIAKGTIVARVERGEECRTVSRFYTARTDHLDRGLRVGADESARQRPRGADWRGGWRGILLGSPCIVRDSAGTGTGGATAWRACSSRGQGGTLGGQPL